MQVPLEVSNGSQILHGATGRVEDFPVIDRIFPERRLAVGLILPLESHPDGPAPTMNDHAAMARLAESMGFSALWLRDVPFFDPTYGDVGQIFEPMAYMAHLAAVTKSIALGTAGVVLPLREPKLLAKQATTVDQLTEGRLVMGLSSGDRPAEYPLYDIDYESRAERFRDAFEVYSKVSSESFPTFDSAYYGRSSGTHDLVPKAHLYAIPTIAIGRAQQTDAWLAAHMDGVIVPAPPIREVRGLVSNWRSVVKTQCGQDAEKPMGIAGFLDLVEDSTQPFRRIRGGFRTGSEGLSEFLKSAAAAGVQHVALNPKISRRPYFDIMTELVEKVFPNVPAYAEAIHRN
jgi:luciferase-type oxidoreductase